MASGRKSKAARRVAAAASPAVGAKGARRASPKVLAGVGGLVVLAAVAIVLGVVLGGGKSTTLPSVPALGTLSNALPGAADAQALFKGIPQHGMTLGRSSAPTTLVEYVDLQCPVCQQVEAEVLPDVLARYVRTGKVKIVAHPLAFIGPADSIRGRNAMIAAAQQNRAFNFAELLYLNQRTENTGWLSEAMVAQAAASIPGLHVHELLSARNSAAVSKLAAQYDTLGTADKVTGTPTFIVRPSLGSGKSTTLVSPTKQQLTTALDG